MGTGGLTPEAVIWCNWGDRGLLRLFLLFLGLDPSRLEESLFPSSSLGNLLLFVCTEEFPPSSTLEIKGCWITSAPGEGNLWHKDLDSPAGFRGEEVDNGSVFTRGSSSNMVMEWSGERGMEYDVMVDDDEDMSDANEMLLALSCRKLKSLSSKGWLSAKESKSASSENTENHLKLRFFHLNFVGFHFLNYEKEEVGGGRNGG